MTARSKQLFGEINITPLTDIFLVLLIIMMVVAPLLNYRGLNVVMAPDGTAASSPDEPDAFLVSVDASGAISVAGQAVSSSDLASAIKQESDQKPGGVVIEVHPDAPLEFMALALDAAGNAGVQKVRIAELRPAAEPEPTPPAKPPAPAKSRKRAPA